MKDTYQFNAPIKRLLRDFENKKSGKVVESRREIKRRFDYIDRSQQVKFLKLCFNSGKSDREWALAEVTKHWDNQFYDIVEELWRQHHDEAAAYCIAKNFPLEYLTKEAANLYSPKTYYDLCLRLGAFYPITIDASRLTPLQALSLYLKTQYNAHDSEVIEQLYRLLYNIGLDYGIPFKDLDRTTIPGFRNIAQCQRAMYFVMELQQYYAMQQWNEWDECVKYALCNDQEYCILTDAPISDMEYYHKMSRLYQKHLIEYLDTLEQYAHIGAQLKAEKLYAQQYHDDYIYDQITSQEEAEEEKSFTYDASDDNVYLPF